MSDLISRKVLIDDIRKYVSGTPLQEMFETIIDKQPTTYDVDKVVEQLNSIPKHDKNRITVYLNDVIEVVKGGGRDE